MAGSYPVNRRTVQGVSIHSNGSGPGFIYFSFGCVGDPTGHTISTQSPDIRASLGATERGSSPRKLQRPPRVSGDTTNQTANIRREKRRYERDPGGT